MKSLHWSESERLVVNTEVQPTLNVLMAEFTATVSNRAVVFKTCGPDDGKAVQPTVGRQTPSVCSKAPWTQQPRRNNDHARFRLGPTCRAGEKSNRVLVVVCKLRGPTEKRSSAIFGKHRGKMMKAAFVQLYIAAFQ